MRRFHRVGLLALSVLSSACAERPPPGRAIHAGAGPSASPSASVNAVPAVPVAVTSESAPAPSMSAPALSAAAPEAPAPNLAESALLAADGTPLPQTEERPRVESPAFQRRMELLADAILKDNPEIAKAAFFPVVAYAQVKAVAKPERDWQLRLMRHFERDLHEYHRALGRDREGATFAGVEVNDAQVRWMKPGSEGNRLGYFRVLRSRLRFATSAGKVRELELTSMISWRGEWYVVHLHGFE